MNFLRGLAIIWLTRRRFRGVKRPGRLMPEEIAAVGKAMQLVQKAAIIGGNGSSG